MGSNSKSVLTLKGFDKLLQQIQEAGADVDKAVVKAMEESVDIVYSDLQEEAHAVGVPDSVTQAIKKDPVKSDGNYISGAVGWKLGQYNPRNLSQGYKAVFMNYGAVRKNRGTIAARGFIAAAKEKSKKNVKAVQRKTFNEIIKGLEIE